MIASLARAMAIWSGKLRSPCQRAPAESSEYTSMGQSGAKQPPARISGQTIVDELIRNMELGRLEMGYSILLPCIFSIYLHPDDYGRLAGVQDLIKEDAKRALNARLAEWNGRNSRFRRGDSRKPCRIAQNDWS